MGDTVTRKQRSWNMSRIRSKDTGPELRVRSALHKAGYRFRLYDVSLSGKPDLVFSKFKVVLFIHGCFWHHHNGCRRANFPKSNKKYWNNKIKCNILRDKRNIKLLKKEGWSAIVIWECQTRNPEVIRRIFQKQLERVHS